MLIRQFAIIKHYLYLQNFASSEEDEWYHSHQWWRVYALGLFGDYLEERVAETGEIETIQRRAPYFFSLDAGRYHHVRFPSKGHTSLFLGLGREDDLKHYFNPKTGKKVHWDDFILKNNRVKRI